MTAPLLRRIGRYRLEQVIGAGGFAVVHRALDERLDDTVAIKVLADNHCLDPDMRERFIAEGRVLRRIDSQHVIAVHDMGETAQQQLYLVLEHADRGTLAARVADLRAAGWTPSRDDVLVVARSLAAAVQAVHRADVVHRDLSPRNLLLRSTVAPRRDAASAVIRSDERLLLADLGMCKDLALHSGLTVSGGTEGFRPPEQRGGPSRIDARADLWALSALLVWLLTGRPPGDLPVARALTAAGFPRLAEVLVVGLAADPAGRHADVAAWHRDVESALAPALRGDTALCGATGAVSGGAEAGPVGTTSPVPVAATVAPQRSRPVRRGRLLRAVALLVTGAVLGAGALLVDGGGDATSLTRLPDGRVEAAREAGGARVAIVAPTDVTVDEVATLEAEMRGIDDWVWLLPGGGIEAGARRVRLRPRSVGVARVTLVGVTGSGVRIEAVHELHVGG